jgi:hypothetical protein
LSFGDDSAPERAPALITVPLQSREQRDRWRVAAEHAGFSDPGKWLAAPADAASKAMPVTRTPLVTWLPSTCRKGNRKARPKA